MISSHFGARKELYPLLIQLKRLIYNKNAFLIRDREKGEAEMVTNTT